MGIASCVSMMAAVTAVALAVIAGLYTGELAIFRHKEPGARWVNWIGEFDCGNDVIIERPKSLTELQEAVRRHSSVRAAATGHSFNPFACPRYPSGAVVDMMAFREVKLTHEDGLHFVTAEGGIKMGQLQNEILAKGFTLRVPPGNSAYTIGGCIATGCHNLGQSHAQDLISVTLVTHDGQIRKVGRGDPDFKAAAVSLGRMGIILSATLEVLPYRSLQWSSEQIELPSTSDILQTLGAMTKRQTSQETVGNKLVFYLATGVLMLEHWVPTGRSGVGELDQPLPPYVNPQSFRLGQGLLSRSYFQARDLVFKTLPLSVLTALQTPAEHAFRTLHSSPMLSKVRKAMGWQHSPEARGEASDRPTGNQYTWAGWVDEVANLIMGLRHVEVIFPLEPKDRAAKCLETVFAHKHLAWWRLNIRTQQSEDFHISSTHGSSKRESPEFFLRVDFVAPGGLLDQLTGEPSLTKQLRESCPGWRKHWGKGLFNSSMEDRWGDPDAFLAVVARWDPEGKFVPRSSPSWLVGEGSCATGVAGCEASNSSSVA